MIGSLLFYALYPLSRYLPGRVSEAPKKSSPPAAVDGSAQCDAAAAAATDESSQSEPAALDRWLSATGGPGGGAGDAREPGMDRGLPTAVLCDGAEPAAADGRSAVSRDEPEGTREHSQEGGDAPSAREVKKEVAEDGSSPSNADLSPQQVLATLLKCLRTTDGVHETACKRTMSSAAAVTPAERDAAEIAPQVRDPAAEKLRSTAEAGPAECWDEYVLHTAVRTEDANSAPPALAPPPSDAGTSRRNAPSSWRFSAGPGLEDEVRCPMWEFPAASYYPSSDAASPLEVIWRLWEDLGEDAAAAAAEPGPAPPFPFRTASVDFTVMSYNILAQDLLEGNRDLYAHCPLEVLDWSYRRGALLGEIRKWSPDILCLQEVQENHYEEDLRPALSQMGYTCVFKRRTGTKTDGCATCYRAGRFSEAAAAARLEFFRPETELLDRHNVGVVVLLRLLTPGERGPPLCVANTHLLFNPRRGDVKLAQAAVLLAEIDRAVRSRAAGGERCNVILCGDFNSAPHSALYWLITGGELCYQHLPLWMVSGQEDLSYKMHCPRLSAPPWPSSLGITDSCRYSRAEAIPDNPGRRGGYSHGFMLSLRYCPAARVRPRDLPLLPGVTDNTPDPSSGTQPYNKRFRHSLSHGFDLESVYEHTLPGSGHPEVTTLHPERGATVDYIFYSPERAAQQKDAGGGGGLKLTGRLSLLSEDVLWSMHGLPNHVFPSDHLSLLAKFKLDVNVA